MWLCAKKDGNDKHWHTRWFMWRYCRRRHHFTTSRKWVKSVRIVSRFYVCIVCMVLRTLHTRIQWRREWWITQSVYLNLSKLERNSWFDVTLSKLVTYKVLLQQQQQRNTHTNHLIEIYDVSLCSPSLSFAPSLFLATCRSNLRTPIVPRTGLQHTITCLGTHSSQYKLV